MGCNVLFVMWCVWMCVSWIANKTRKRGKSGSNSRQSGKSTSVLGILAGAAMLFQPNASRGVSNRSGSRGSSMSGQIKASTSGNVNVGRNNTVVPAQLTGSIE
eukprot:10812391-Prorocentrum_lima.AAC.1